MAGLVTRSEKGYWMAPGGCSEYVKNEKVPTYYSNFLNLLLLTPSESFIVGALVNILVVKIF